MHTAAGINWGTVPDWFAAVGTVGTLLLGVGLLSRELNDRRSQQARQLICALQYSRKWDAILTLHNASDLAITAIDVEVRKVKWYETHRAGSYTVVPTNGRRSLNSGEACKIVLDYPDRRFPDPDGSIFDIQDSIYIRIEFHDAWGRSWLRVLDEYNRLLPLERHTFREMIPYEFMRWSYRWNRKIVWNLRSKYQNYKSMRRARRRVRASRRGARAR